MKPLLFTEEALNIITTKDIPSDWFVSPSQISSLDPILVIENESGVFILAPGSGDNSRKLVLKRSAEGLFGSVPGPERRQVFDRCARIALRDWGSSVQLNPKWMPYHSRNLVSVYAYGEKSGFERIVAESRPLDSHDVFVCEFSPVSGVYNLDDFKPDHAPYEKAIAGFQGAVEASKRRPNVPIAGQIELDDVVPSDISKNLTYSEWSEAPI